MAESGCLRDANFQNIQAGRIQVVEQLVFNNNIMKMDPNTNKLIVGDTTFNPSNTVMDLTAGMVVSGDELSVHNQNISVYSDTGTTSVFSVIGENGNTTIAGNLTINGVGTLTTLNVSDEVELDSTLNVNDDTTINGSLTLAPYEPTDDNHATHKKYVDD